MEDSFFLADKCCRRALAVGDVSAIVAVFDGVRETLEGPLAAFLGKRARQQNILDARSNHADALMVFPQ